MVIHRVLDQVFRSRSHVAVLRVLLFTTSGFTGNAVARQAGMHPRSALNALGALEDLGIVRRQRGGRDHIFTLNRDHALVTTAILPAFTAELEFRKCVFTTLATALRGSVLSAVVFGSVARREETASSDLDLCCVVRTAAGMEPVRAAINAVAPRLSRTFGVKIAPVLVTLTELRRKSKLSLVQAILETGEVVTGNGLKDLLHD